MEFFQSILEALNRIADNVEKPSIVEWFLAGAAVLSAITAIVAAVIARISVSNAKKMGNQIIKIIDIFAKQAKLEDEKAIRYRWEHTVNYAPWLLMELRNLSLEEQINKGPFIFFEKGYTARMKGYRVNKIDLSEGTDPFQISEKNKDKGKQYPNLLERLNNNKEKYDGLMSIVKKSVQTKKHAAIDIIYRDMGSDYLYIRTFYFDYDQHKKRLNDTPKPTYDSPRPFDGQIKK